LRCPGCYAYNDEHLGGEVTLRQVSDYKGDELVENFFKLVDEHKPLHLSIVGGEPLVRFRELNTILPRLAERGIYSQLVTSAVRPIPTEWATLRRLQIVVSIDGLQPEHDVRRTPATYDRILKHIAGHKITVHCTVTRQQVQRDGYLEEFIRFWSANENVRTIWVSLYTPQLGEVSVEQLLPEDRTRVVADLMHLRRVFPKLQMPEGLIKVYADPPANPDECVFAQTTTCVSADFKHPISPCQFGGNPDCSNCGCIASAGLGAIARHRLRACPSGVLRTPAWAAGSTRCGRAPPRPRAFRLWRPPYPSISRPASTCRRSTTPSIRRARKSRSGTTSRDRVRRSS
jgi:sulfatase maturation enzyme AslB (radical SAM superfamily)